MSSGRRIEVSRAPAKLNELGLSPNTMSALRKEGLEEVDQLCSATSMLGRPEFRDGIALYEIVCALNQHGRRLPMSNARGISSDRDLEIFKLRIVEGLLLRELAQLNNVNVERIRQILMFFGVSGSPPAARQRRQHARRRAPGV